MKIAAVSDLHGIFKTGVPELFDQEIDLLLVAGDIAGGSHLTHAQYKSMADFFHWVKEINPKQCFITPGNHDYWNWDQLAKYRENPGNIECLIDSSAEYEGLVVHGTPWTPIFENWNYMKEDHNLKPHWENIDQDTDILMTHGPALGKCDMPLEMVGNEFKYENLGSKSLLDELCGRDIPYVISGHIHSASHNWDDLSRDHKTLCRCVSVLDEGYKWKYPVTEWTV